MDFKTGLICLGCPKNIADLEALITKIDGLKIVPVEKTDFIILNTCGFLKSARDEVLENLLTFKNKKIILIGCMAGLFKISDFEKYPQIIAIVSSRYYSDIGKIFSRAVKGEKIYATGPEPIVFDDLGGKKLLTPKAFSYIKIAEGCNNHCSYCMIPFLKGRYRSRPMENIVSEIKTLVEADIKEIILVAQDCGYYGVDLYGKKSLTSLLKKIIKISGDFRVRILYVYPERIDEDLLSLIQKSKKICKYLDVPLQHGDAKILKAMNRPYDVSATLKKIEKIRKIVPEISLRTSIIVGFPGETKENFENLKKFVKEIKFDLLGAFEYSREPNTAAYSMKNQISSATKKARRNALMKIQQKISLMKNQALTGKTVRVLIENYDEKAGLYFGRSDHFAPEIDGRIMVTSLKKLKLNEFHNVKIIKGFEYDLLGKVI